jgi:ABC-type antimicrobial peptide transport system permease subunit
MAAVIGLALGIVGLYGAISYTVAQRTAEIGVRIALGANPAAVCAMVLRQGISIILPGIAIGVVAAGSLARYIASMLFEVSVFDPLRYVAGRCCWYRSVCWPRSFRPAVRPIPIPPRPCAWRNSTLVATSKMRQESMPIAVLRYGKEP